MHDVRLRTINTKNAADVILECTILHQVSGDSYLSYGILDKLAEQSGQSRGRMVFSDPSYGQRTGAEPVWMLPTLAGKDASEHINLHKATAQNHDTSCLGHLEGKEGESNPGLEREVEKEKRRSRRKGEDRKTEQGERTMSTGSLSDVEDLQEVEMLECDGLKMDTNKEFGASNESNEEGSNGENGSPQKGRGASGKRKKAPPKKSPLNGVSQEGKQVQRNAANARERARMRVLSKAFSRLKTTLPWVPPDTKLSKLDTLRLASSYIAHLRQILANDKYENGYIHPVNLTWPFMVAGKPESDLKEVVNTNRLCGPTAS
ncbi:Tcf21 [Columba livia]|nr:Tcf21 [Columba livia]